MIEYSSNERWRMVDSVSNPIRNFSKRFITWSRNHRMKWSRIWSTIRELSPKPFRNSSGVPNSGRVGHWPVRKNQWGWLFYSRNGFGRSKWFELYRRKWITPCCSIHWISCEETIFSETTPTSPGTSSEYSLRSEGPLRRVTLICWIFGCGRSNSTECFSYRHHSPPLFSLASSLKPSIEHIFLT